ncbi:MAG TPA: interleukin-like EMT inducer domain-containing protein [Methylomirabilota bacterium]|nr:interleukin-like EMT inducer domain-containing protein [Methylomirabilota bacterium]
MDAGAPEPARDPPGPHPGPASLRPPHVAVVLLLFAATAIAYTYPLVRDLEGSGLVGGGDLFGALGRIGAFARQILINPRGLFDTRFFYPYSNTHAYWAPFWLVGAVAAPAIALTGRVVLVTNLLVLAAFAVSGLLAYGLVWRLTGNVPAGLVAGLLFAFHPNRLDHLGQFTVQMGVLLPAVLWAFYRWYLEGRWRHVLLVAVGTAAQALLSLYAGYALGFLLLGLGLVLLVVRPRLCSPGRLLQTVAAAALLAALLLPFLRPYFAVHRELGFERDIRLLEVASMDLLALFDAGSFNALYHRRLLRTGGVEGGLFPGFIALALAGLAPWLARGPGDAAPRWRRRGRRAVAAVALAALGALVLTPALGGIRLGIGSVRVLTVTRLTGPLLFLLAALLAWVGLEGRQAEREPLSPREWTVALVFLAAVTYALTLSPNLTVLRRVWGHGPAWWIYQDLPGGRGFGAPGRWAPGFILLLAMLAGLGAAALSARLPGRWARVGPWLLVAAILVELRPVPLDYDHVPPPGAVYRWLAEQPGDVAVLELPVGNGRLQSFYMYAATAHGKRLVNGELGFVPPMMNELADVTRPLDLPAFLERVRSIYPLRYVVVHHPALGAAEHAAWEAIRREPGPALRLVRQFDGPDDVFEVLPTPEVGVEIQRHFSLDFVRRHPVVEFEVGYRGRDDEVTRGVDVLFNDRLVRRVAASGAGTEPLAPPYHLAERNTVRFVHRYRLRPEVVAQPRYRIGTTMRQAPVDIEALSAGKLAGNDVSIRVNGLETVALPRRGYNVVALAADTGQVLLSENFDTFIAAEESRRMAAAIERLPEGTVVVAAVKGDGGGALQESGVGALRAIGASRDLRGTLWLSHLVVGVKGARPGTAWEAAGPEALRVVIGRVRPLGLVLERFALREPGPR